MIDRYDESGSEPTIPWARPDAGVLADDGHGWARAGAAGEFVADGDTWGPATGWAADAPEETLIDFPPPAGPARELAQPVHGAAPRGPLDVGDDGRAAPLLVDGPPVRYRFDVGEPPWPGGHRPVLNEVVEVVSRSRNLIVVACVLFAAAPLLALGVVRSSGGTKDPGAVRVEPRSSASASPMPAASDPAGPSAATDTAGAGQVECHSSYTACVPLAVDVDCAASAGVAGDAGDGPVFVEGPSLVVGDDPYDLDRNDDLVACHHGDSP